MQIRKLACAIVIVGISGSGISHASDGVVDISLSIEGTGDSVEQSPNLAEGGFAPPETKQRFQAYALGVDWYLSRRTSLGLSLAKRELNSLRDSYEINQLAFEASTDIASVQGSYSLVLNARLVANQADQLLKNSFTHYNGATLRSASIDNPQDLALILSLTASRDLGRRINVSGKFGVGMTESTHDSIQGYGEGKSGCVYTFSAADSTGSLQQQGICGAVLSYSQQFASEDGVEDRLGFRPSRDIAYTSRFVETELEMAWSYKAVSMALAYRLRYYNRDKLDQRVLENGDTPTRLSQVASLAMAYRLSKRWAVSLMSIYQTAPFLDEIPMLYTAFTSERYSGADSLSFRLAVTLRL